MRIPSTARHLFVGRTVLAVVLAAPLLTGCGGAGSPPGGASPDDARVVEAPARTEDVGLVEVEATQSPVGDPAPGEPAFEGNDPECDVLLGTGELGGASGRDDWTLTNDDDEMPDTDIACQWDRGELYTYGWQHLDVNVWSGDTAASFLEGGLPGDPESVGDGGAWDPIGGRLLVRVGDRVLGIDPGPALGDADPRAGALELAANMLPRIPR